MAEHTAGKLKIEGGPRKIDHLSIVTDDGTEQLVADAEGGNEIDVPTAMANARRLVAAWNLLEHLPTEFIERAAARLATLKGNFTNDAGRVMLALSLAEDAGETPGG